MGLSDFGRTPDARPYRLLRHLRTAGRPVRAERLPFDRDDPAGRAAVASELRALQARGVVEATPHGWLWKEETQ